MTEETAPRKRYTQEGYQKLQDELKDRKENLRIQIKQQLAEARSHGDLSENSEYDEARDAQAKNESRIQELEEELKNIKPEDIIKDSDTKKGVVNIGSTVEVYDKTFDETVKYTIVGSNEVDAFENLISDSSPIGAALLGKRKGDTVTYTAPCGEVELEIKKVSKVKHD